MAGDTIFAHSSGRPPAAIAIIRISGPRAHAAGQALGGSLPAAREAAVRELRDGSGALLDRALVLRFDAPASATGEDSVELHCHGGRAVVDAVLSALTGMDGLRAAEPGEFTRRAFANGRIDLTEAEGLADLIEAETESQRKAALALAEGGLRRQIAQWQERLLTLSAEAERAIDYVGDEEETEDPARALACADLARELEAWLARPRAEPLKDGVRVVVAGPPNAGKSSLINAIVGSDRVIVSDVAGTTRDYVEVPLALRGVPMVLTDTAGLRATVDQVEAIGVERAESLVEAADILLWLGAHDAAPRHPRPILLHSKADMPDRSLAPADSLAVSAVSGAGIPALLERIAAAAAALLPAEDAIALNRRQAAHLVDAAGALRDAASCRDPVLAAEGLRAARAAFDRMTGRADFEDVLDALFSRFCLGK
ncbi:tRNA uridine-5-carboxymethylaminomethyl(34) synthesis GTPase MnmE [Sphingomonas lutea]|uniref:tRNA modification GTPase MnmE n=1 Tax=Sphingomonas lutea TaxID=1045317 RepID=A0A7G9SIH6_9SPHN|nr:tRNA uridine-5-carboxymethylaminomethyl(34) synthesis GTPase MnmE [Sphingomonas lutea]QNN67651.1 tRNA uridine-5-carboxymethylaminomethyl(34) synthesis GTPase MnmE [Sphingomonas lutea]